MTADQLGAIASEMGISFDEDERKAYANLVSETATRLDKVFDHDPNHSLLTPSSLDGRSAACRPSDEDDPYNAWITRFEVKTDTDGSLSGVSVGLKDSIAVAGYEMTAGSRILEGFVPEIDAAVTTRLLEAGAGLAGKLNMESFAWSGIGDISDFGAVTNPYDDGYLAGGSSSGSGVAPVTGDCDVTLGTDQAGSIRIPSSWCGLVGLKPTHGLVPYTGIVPLEHSIDHVGPMAESVELVARTLDVIAGVYKVDRIQLDPRQPESIPDVSYVDTVSTSVEGRSVALLEEGFGWDHSEAVVDDTVERAALEFESLGVDVDRVNIPAHRDGITAWPPIAIMGGAQLLREGGVGTTQGGWSWTRLARTIDAMLNARADELPPSVVRALLASEHLEAEFGLEPYSRARRLVLEIRQAYDEVLETFDALILPTTATRAIEYRPDRTKFESILQSGGAIHNTCSFNLTGHPAISIPCAKRNGLPVGMMLVGDRFDDQTLLELAESFESEVDWGESA